MKIKLLYILLFLYGVTYGQKMKVGGEFSGGVSIMGVKSELLNTTAYFEKYRNSLSYSFSGVFQYQLKKDWWVNTGLGLTVKSMAYSFYRDTVSKEYPQLQDVFNKKLQYNVAYLRLPAEIRYYTHLLKDPNFQPYFDLGFMTDFKLHNGRPKTNGISNNDGFKYHGFLDFNLSFGGGMILKTRTNNHITFGVKVVKGLINSTTSSYGNAEKKVRLVNNQLLFTFSILLDYEKLKKVDPTGVSY